MKDSDTAAKQIRPDSSDVVAQSEIPDAVSHFDEASFAASPRLVDCTLSEGTQAIPDLSEAASKIGVSEDALGQVIRSAGGPPPDFEKIAPTLGVSDLKASMPSRR